jgi:hypothetical protein
MKFIVASREEQRKKTKKSAHVSEYGDSCVRMSVCVLVCACAACAVCAVLCLGTFALTCVRADQCALMRTHTIVRVYHGRIRVGAALTSRLERIS